MYNLGKLQLMVLHGFVAGAFIQKVLYLEDPGKSVRQLIPS